MHEHVSAARELLHLRKGSTIAGINERVTGVPESKSECHEIWLEVAGVAGFDTPFTFFDHVSERQLGNAWIGALSRQHAAPRLINGQAAAMACARHKIRVIDASLTEQLVSHVLKWWRAVHLEVRHATRPLVPTRQHEPCIVATMIVMKVGKEDVGDLSCLNSQFEETMMGPEAMIEHNNVVLDLHHVAGTHSSQRRGRCSGSEEADSHGGNSSIDFQASLILPPHPRGQAGTRHVVAMLRSAKRERYVRCQGINWASADFLERSAPTERGLQEIGYGQTLWDQLPSNRLTRCMTPISRAELLLRLFKVRANRLLAQLEQLGNLLSCPP